MRFRAGADKIWKLVCCVAICLLISGCCGISGDGRIVEKSFFLDPVARIDISGEWNVVIRPDQERSEAVIRIDGNLLDLISVENGNGGLSIRPKEGERISPSVTPEIALNLNYMPARFALRGAVRAEVAGPLRRDSRWRLSGSSILRIPEVEAHRLGVLAGGSTSIEIQGALERCFIRLYGSSDVDISGQVGDLVLEQHGSSRVRVFKCDSADLALSGSSQLEIEATALLRGHASGSTRIRYAGSPELRMGNSGSCSIAPLE